MIEATLTMDIEVDVQEAFDELFTSDQIEFMIDNIECIPDENIKMEYEKRFGNRGGLI